MAQITLDDITLAIKLSGMKNFDGKYQSLGGGEINDTFLIDCGGEKAVLRVAKHPDQNSLHQEALALQLLNSPQIPKLIYFNENKLIKDRRWIIESYISGKQVQRLNIDELTSLGKLLAKVHCVKSDKVGVNIWASFLDECKMFGDEQTLLTHPDPKLRKLINNATSYFNSWQAKLNEVAVSLIHGDATPSNVMTNNGVISLIDWELSKFKDPLAEFSTIFYEDMEYNQGKWRVHIRTNEKAALYDGYTSAGGVIDEARINFWMNFDKLGAAVFLYWRINQSNREATPDQKTQYQLDLNNLFNSLERNLTP